MTINITNAMIYQTASPEMARKARIARAFDSSFFDKPEEMNKKNKQA